MINYKAYLSEFFNEAMLEKVAAQKSERGIFNVLLKAYEEKVAKGTTEYGNYVPLFHRLGGGSTRRRKSRRPF